MTLQNANPTEQDSTFPKQRWAVAQVFSKRAPQLATEIQDLGCGTAMPTYNRVHYRAGKRLWVRRQALPGYMFVKVDDDDRGRVSELEGVYRFLAGGERAMARMDAEMPRFELGLLMGDGNDVERAPVEPGRRRRRRRRPRPGRRFRAKAVSP